MGDGWGMIKRGSGGWMGNDKKFGPSIQLETVN